MSQTSVAQAANDADLQKRIQAAIYSEAIGNAELSKTHFASLVKQGFANLTGMYWAVADATEQSYESGLLAGRGSPGHDADVITDGQITSAVVANWPPDPEIIPL